MLPEIEQVRKKLGHDFTLLQGSEVEIRADGQLDFDDAVLASLDIVVASLHTSLRQPRAPTNTSWNCLPARQRRSALISTDT